MSDDLDLDNDDFDSDDSAIADDAPAETNKPKKPSSKWRDIEQLMEERRLKKELQDIFGDDEEGLNK